MSVSSREIEYGREMERETYIYREREEIKQDWEGEKYWQNERNIGKWLDRERERERERKILGGPTSFTK